MPPAAPARARPPASPLRGAARVRLSFLSFPPVSLLAGACLLLGFAGCASPPPAPSAPSAPLTTDALLALQPEGAYLRDGQLLLQYSSGSERLRLGAAWPDDPAGNAPAYHTTVIEPLAADAGPPDPMSPPSGWRPVRLLDHAEWQVLVRQLLEDLAAGPDEAGTLVTVQGRDFVLQRDRAGALQIYRMEHKPAALRVGRRIDEAGFAAHANALLQTKLAQDGAPLTPVLFDIGADELGGAFVLFDPSYNRTVFIAQPPSPLPPGQKLGFSLRLIDALTLRSHMLGALRTPVTMGSRLVWLTAHSGATLLPRGVATAADTPPLAPSAAMDPVAWEAELDRLVGDTRTKGKLQPLIDGEAFFVALVQAIQDARESVDIRLYIFDSDDYALRIADLLRKRSREIRVRVLVDRLGTLAAGQVPSKSPYYSAGKPPLSIADYLRRDSAVEVRQLDNPWLTSDHTKVIVIDSRRAFLGGMNIGREYRYEWHDLMVDVDGPVVEHLARNFENRWAHAGPGGDLAFAAASLRRTPSPMPQQTANAIDIRPLHTRTGDAQILRTQLAAIRRARSHIYIQQPYVSDDEVIAALIEARHRGVEVRVILPTRNDSGLMNSANLLAARAFIRNGIRVYGYPGMTHVKAALYDGWACLGSANFDKLSLRINQETNLATSDPGFVEILRRELFEADFARSQEWTAAQPVRWNDYIAEFIADQL